MTNRELLKEILKDKPIRIRGLIAKQIIEIIDILKQVYNIKENTLSAWNGYTTKPFMNCDYIYYHSKSRTIKKGVYSYKTKKWLLYCDINTLESLLNESTSVNAVYKELKHKQTYNWRYE